MRYYVYSTDPQNNRLILEKEYGKYTTFYNHLNYLIVFCGYEVSIYYDNENESVVAVIE